MDLIAKKCPHGYRNAKDKVLKYGGVNRYGGFEKGVCAISWMLYPEGRYFADSDGFGGEDNEEECVYAIMDTHLDFIVPFRPVDNIEKLLEEVRAHTCGSEL